jgi:hypothetical protein
MGLLDSILSKISTKKPEDVAAAKTINDGWYMMGHDPKVPAKEQPREETEEKKE